VLLNQAHRAGGARALLERQAHADADHLFMRTAKAHVQKAQWVEQWLRGVPERFEDRLLRDLGCARTVCVPAHAVDHDKQNRMLSDGRDDTILVFFACPEQ
jgi:hypothetical protein